MLKDSENLRDSEGKQLPSYGASTQGMSIVLSYNKLNKLVTALYMVTDIMNKDEPLRNKLRDLGTKIISDVYTNPIQANQKVAEILSFLDITSAIGMISQMNSNILKREFLGLQHSIQEYSKQSNPMWLEEFMVDPEKDLIDQEKDMVKDNISIHQGHSTRLGIQKGGTLMRALNQVQVHSRPISMSDKVSALDIRSARHDSGVGTNFDILKKQRREQILKIIKEKGEATITDIRTMAKQLPSTNVLASCGEKTLQRELISMIKDKVLKKSGEKRWSRYFI